MLEKGKISSFATFLMVGNIVGATAIVFLPAVAAKFARQDAWMTPVIATVPGIAVILVVTELGRRFPGKTIIEYLQIILGNWLGKAIGVLYLFFFIHTNSVIIREFGELFGTLAMPRTPILVFHAAIVLLGVYAVRSGLEVIARLFELITPFVFIVYTFLLILSLHKTEFSRLLPVLENGFQPVLLGSVTPSAWRGEVMLLAMLLPYIVKPREGRYIGLLAVILTGVALTTDAIFNTAFFGPEATRLVFPTFTIIKGIEIGGFLRFDPFIVSVWVASVWTKIALFYYVGVLGTAQLLNLKDYKPVILPIGVILTALSSLVVQNSVELPLYFTSGFPPFASLFEWVIPFALLLIAIARGCKSKY